MAESKLDIVLNPKGFDNIEKAVRGVRTEFAALDKQIVVGGKDIGSLADAFHGMGLQIPANPMALLGEVTGKVIQFTQQAISETNAYNISMSKLAVTLGIGVEETSRMIQAGDDLGTSQEALTTALQFASKGGLAPTIENLANTSDKLLAMTDLTARNAAATKIFGRSWFEASQTILAGGDAIRAAAAAQSGGLVVTEEAAAATEKNRIAMDAWNDSMQNVKLSLGNQFVPSLTTAINSILLMTGGLDENTAAALRNEAGYQRMGSQWIEQTIPIENGVTKGMLAHTAALQAQGEALLGITSAANGAAISLGNLSNAEAAKIAMDKLSKALADGTITESQYVIQSESIMRGIGGMTEAQIDANLKTRVLTASLAEGKITAAEYAGMITNINSALNGMHDKTITITTIHRDINEGGSPKGGRAAGGPVTGGQPYLVGELGPELFTPTTSGYITNNYNLSIHSNARVEQVESDYHIMQSLWG
jgi:hypothetical protein